MWHGCRLPEDREKRATCLRSRPRLWRILSVGTLASVTREPATAQLSARNIHVYAPRIALCALFCHQWAVDLQYSNVSVHSALADAQTKQLQVREQGLRQRLHTKIASRGYWTRGFSSRVCRGIQFRDRFARRLGQWLIDVQDTTLVHRGPLPVLKMLGVWEGGGWLANRTRCREPNRSTFASYNTVGQQIDGPPVRGHLLSFGPFREH